MIDLNKTKHLGLRNVYNLEISLNTNRGPTVIELSGKKPKRVPTENEK